MNEVVAKYAQLTITGVGINKAIDQLRAEFNYPFTRTQVERLRYNELYIKVTEEYNRSVVRKAINELRKGVSDLVPKIIQNITENLEKGNINAVAPALKIMGIENTEEGPKHAQNLTVVLPGARKDIKDVT